MNRDRYSSILYSTEHEIQTRERALRKESQRQRLLNLAEKLCLEAGQKITLRQLRSKTDNQLHNLIDAAVVVLEERPHTSLIEEQTGPLAPVLDPIKDESLLRQIHLQKRLNALVVLHV